jgi:hypothetical protein
MSSKNGLTYNAPKNMNESEISTLVDLYAEEYIRTFNEVKKSLPYNKAKAKAAAAAKADLPTVDYALTERAKHMQGRDSAVKSNVAIREIGSRCATAIMQFHANRIAKSDAQPHLIEDGPTESTVANLDADSSTGMAPTACFEAWFENHDTLDYAKDFYSFLSLATGLSYAGWRGPTRRKDGKSLDKRGWVFEHSDSGITCTSRPAAQAAIPEVAAFTKSELDTIRRFLAIAENKGA